MTENQKQIDKQDVTKNNMWTAVVLGVIALIVGIMPFFLLSNMS